MEVPFIQMISGSSTQIEYITGNRPERYRGRCGQSSEVPVTSRLPTGSRESRKRAETADKRVSRS